MKIAPMLEIMSIIPELHSCSKKDVLYELAGPFANGKFALDCEFVAEVLLERERLGSTGIGDGVAIPHGKINGMKSMAVSFGRSRRGIDFNSLDGKPVHLFFALLAPEDSGGQHLKALAKLSRMLKDGEFRAGLLRAPSVQAIYELISEKEF